MYAMRDGRTCSICLPTELFRHSATNFEKVSTAQFDIANYQEPT